MNPVMTGLPHRPVCMMLPTPTFCQDDLLGCGPHRHRLRELTIIDSVASIIPARHRERYSGSLRRLSTIRP